MSWENCLSLLRGVSGRVEDLSHEQLAEATAEGPGDQATQLNIARAEYERQCRGTPARSQPQKRKEANSNGQEKWEFA